MKKILLIVIIAIGLIIIAILPKNAGAPSVAPQENVIYPLNLTYEVDEDIVQFRDGKAELGDASFETYGSPVYGDLGRGSDSSAIFIVKETAGTGVFFFVGVGYEEEGEVKGSTAAFIGDRIIPQGLKITNGILEVTYLTRGDDEPLAAPATIPAKKFFTQSGGILKEKSND